MEGNKKLHETALALVAPKKGILAANSVYVSIAHKQEYIDDYFAVLEPIFETIALCEADKKNIETHCRDMVILPEMIGKTIKIHRGNSFVMVVIEPEMIGHFLGEFALTRKKIEHSAPGVGATRSSANISVK